MILAPLHGTPGQRQRSRANPAGVGPDTLPKALAALDTLPEPGRLILAPLHGTPGQRPAAEPQGEQGPRSALDRDPLPKPLAKIHGEGFHLVTSQQRATEPQGEPGRRCSWSG